jgi:protein SCO1/2
LAIFGVRICATWCCTEWGAPRAPCPCGPEKTPADAREAASSLARDQPAAQLNRWHLLTGDATSLHGLATALGFRYFYDPRNRQYAHPAGVVVLTGQGRIAQYFFGVQYPPEALRLALVDASHGRLGNLIDRLVLLCCGYDPSTGRYSVLIDRITQIAAIVFLLAAGAVLLCLRNSRKA